jgi:hypothetical protein
VPKGAFLRRIFIIAAITVLAVFGVAPVALAELPSGCVLAHECGPGFDYDGVYSQWLPPGANSSNPSLWAWNPNTQTVEYTGLLGLAVMCENQGGYYYQTADGGYSWNAC